ncbi:hypothetical protein P692DRAFT_201865201 [Suillus brevipes Sb2]|nr:hypothetical protein P692DRAFT_201865201 [Suillus brevipes Sb2]
MNTPVDSFGMPLRTCSAAPRFGGDYTQLVNFLESVERLAQPLGLSDKEIIKYALKYTAPNERELFQYYEGNDYEEFANSALFMYPECGTMRRYTRPTSAISAIPLPPLEAPHEAPLLGAPQQPEHASEQPVAAAMAPVHETCETFPPPPTPTLPIIEIALTPAHMEAPIIGEPAELKSNPEDQLDEDVLPQPEVHEPTAIANAPNAQSEEIASPIISNDLKHPSRFSAPIQEHSAVPELQNAPYLNQSLSLLNPLVTDNTVHIVCSAYSDFRLPVKHPCIALPTHQIDHVLGDPEAPPVHPMAPEVAQYTRLETLYIQPSPFSPFSLISRFSLSTSFSSVTNTSPSPSLKLTIIPSLRRHSRAPHALILAPKAPIITAKFYLHRIFTIPSLLNRIPHIHHDLYFIQPFRHDLGARLTHTHPPTAYIITFNFASFVLTRIFRIFAYRVHITPSFYIKHHSFMIRRLCRLDTSPILIIRALFAPNFTAHRSLTNAFSLFQPILAQPEDIINFVPICANTPASPVAYHAAVHLHHCRLASPWRVPNRRHIVQEFIPPVTSPPLSRRACSASRFRLRRAFAFRRVNARFAFTRRLAPALCADSLADSFSASPRIYSRKRLSKDPLGPTSTRVRGLLQATYPIFFSIDPLTIPHLQLEPTARGPSELTRSLRPTKDRKKRQQAIDDFNRAFPHTELTPIKELFTKKTKGRQRNVSAPSRPDPDLFVARKRAPSPVTPSQGINTRRVIRRLRSGRQSKESITRRIRRDIETTNRWPFQGSAHSTRSPAVCTVCLGRNSHSFIECTAERLWDSAFPAVATPQQQTTTLAKLGQSMMRRLATSRQLLQFLPSTSDTSAHAAWLPPTESQNCPRAR